MGLDTQTTVSQVLNELKALWKLMQTRHLADNIFYDRIKIIVLVLLPWLLWECYEMTYFSNCSLTACKFSQGRWSECDQETQQMTREDTLAKGQQEFCPPKRILTKKCGKKSKSEQNCYFFVCHLLVYTCEHTIVPLHWRSVKALSIKCCFTKFITFAFYTSKNILKSAFLYLQK